MQYGLRQQPPVVLQIQEVPLAAAYTGAAREGGARVALVSGWAVGFLFLLLFFFTALVIQSVDERLYQPVAVYVRKTT